jgi:outer membrane protein TolC
MRLSTAIVILFFAAETASAQEVNQPAGFTPQTPEEQAPQGAGDPNKFTAIEDYLRFAELRNADLKSIYQQWQDALKEIPAQTILDPKLTYGNYVKAEDARAEEERQRVGLSQTLGLFGRKEAQDSESQARAEAARLKYEAEKLRLFWKVREAFYEYAYLIKAAEITQEHVEILQRFEENARQRAVLSAGDYLEFTLAGLEKARLENIQDDFVRRQEAEGARLNATMSRDEDAGLARPVSGKFEPVLVNHKTIVDVLRQRNPELAHLDKEIEAAKNKANLEKAQSYPEIGFGIDFIRTERSMSPDIRPDEKDPTFFMFSMKVPLLRESYEAQQKAIAEVRKKEQERLEAENSILAKTARALYDYEDSITEMQFYREGLFARSKELSRMAENRHRQREENSAGFIDSQRILLFYRLGYERAAANNRQKLAELEMLVGVKLDNGQLKF